MPAQVQLVSSGETQSTAPNRHANRFRTVMETEITLGTYSNMRDMKGRQWKGTYQELWDQLSQPEKDYYTKDGKGFLIGPCEGRRLKANMHFGWLAVLDADQSFGEHYLPQDGAPDPVAVHEALKEENISHCLYTTYSHGMEDKGNRYRVVFPVIVASENELRAFMTHVVELLNTVHNLPIVLTPESHRLAQLWQFPRLRDPEASFLFVSHVGTIPDPAYWERQYDFGNELASRMPVPTESLLRANDRSFYAQIDKYLPIPRQLRDAGYTFVCQGSQRDASGQLINVQRWRKPDSTSAPGVVVFEYENRVVLYSHHSHDPLATGQICDSFDVYRQLKGLDRDTAIPFALEEVQTEIATIYNEQHPSVMLSGNEFKIANRVEDEDGGIEYKYMTWGNFQLLCSNRPPVWKIENNGENAEGALTAVQPDAFWKTCPARQVYQGTTFYPTPLSQGLQKEVLRSKNKYYNTFKGWSVEPKQGSWELLEWHLRNSICGGGEEEYTYLLDWFTHLVQHPREKPGVALVLRGEKGAGKSIAFSKLIRALGKCSIVLGHSDQLTNNFNSHMENRLVVLLEESFWSGNPQAEGVLKTLITDLDTTYTKKGVDSQEGKSYVRVIMNTNSDWAVPVSSDERRFFIPTITDASLKRNETTKLHRDGDFFPFLAREMDFGGIQAFYYDMMHRKITQSIFKAPKTAMLFDQYKESLTKEAAWLYDMLNDGEVRSKTGSSLRFTDTGLLVSMDLIMAAVEPYLSHHEKKHSITNRVEKLLKKMLPTTHWSLQNSNGIMIKFSSLPACRQDYQTRIKMPVEWRQTFGMGYEPGENPVGFSS